MDELEVKDPVEGVAVGESRSTGLDGHAMSADVMAGAVDPAYTDIVRGVQECVIQCKTKILIELQSRSARPRRANTQWYGAQARMVVVACVPVCVCSSVL